MIFWKLGLGSIAGICLQNDQNLIDYFNQKWVCPKCVSTAKSRAPDCAPNAMELDRSKDLFREGCSKRW